VNPINAEELRKQWADVHGVTEVPPRQSLVDGASRRVWFTDEGRPAVETYVIQGLGHATPIDPDAADEDARCGSASASRFILPAGISSTYRIAESWGLIGARRTPRMPGTGRREQTRPEQARTEKAAPRATVWQDYLPGGKEAVQDVAARLGDPGSLIGKVLRSAGLMKGGKRE
jgi:feruloyl esterase